MCYLGRELTLVTLKAIFDIQYQSLCLTSMFYAYFISVIFWNLEETGQKILQSFN